MPGRHSKFDNSGNTQEPPLSGPFRATQGRLIMDNCQSLSHTKWECLYHLVWIPKYRKKKIFTGLRKDLGPVLRELAERKACAVEEGHLMPDHVHVGVNSAEICRVTGCWLHKRKECDLHCADVWWAEAQFYRSTFLGARVLGVHSRPG